MKIEPFKTLFEQQLSTASPTVLEIKSIKFTRSKRESSFTCFVKETTIQTNFIESNKTKMESYIDAATEQADRIWNNDKSVYHDMDRILEWVGNGSEVSDIILNIYFTHFNFTNLKLEQAFRNLCLKLSLKGETQQIDRVLYEFSARYFECNPKCIYSNVDVVHIIVYSIVLLNTDLHVAQGDYKRMTRSEFVNNTMSAIQSISNFPMLISERRISFGSIDWAPLQRTPNQTSSQTTQDSTTQLFDTNDMDSLSFGSKHWQLEIRKILKETYNSIRQNQIGHASAPIRAARNISIALKRSMYVIARKSFSFA